MDEATGAPSGLLAVRGLSAEALDPLCRDAGVHVAIRNAPDRVVVGGRRDALGRAGRDAEARGASVTPIPVDVPSHTPMLRGASDRFDAVLRDLGGVRTPDVRLLSGIEGAAVFDVRDGLAKLGAQVSRTVDWSACMEACHAAGATRALELGPGDALARMMGDVVGERDSRSVADFRSLDGVLRWARS